MKVILLTIFALAQISVCGKTNIQDSTYTFDSIYNNDSIVELEFSNKICLRITYTDFCQVIYSMRGSDSVLLSNFLGHIENKIKIGKPFKVDKLLKKKKYDNIIIENYYRLILEGKWKAFFINQNKEQSYSVKKKFFQKSYMEGHGTTGYNYIVLDSVVYWYPIVGW